MTDRNDLVRAHRLRSLADSIERDGLAATIRWALRDEPSIDAQLADDIEAWFSDAGPGIAQSLRKDADRMERGA